VIPSTRSQPFLVREGFATPEVIDGIQKEVAETIAKAEAEALKSPQPAPETALHHVYFLQGWIPPRRPSRASRSSRGPGPETMVTLINRCLRDEDGA